MQLAKRKEIGVKGTDDVRSRSEEVKVVDRN